MKDLDRRRFIQRSAWIDSSLRRFRHFSPGGGNIASRRIGSHRRVRTFVAQAHLPSQTESRSTPQFKAARSWAATNITLFAGRHNPPRGANRVKIGMFFVSSVRLPEQDRNLLTLMGITRNWRFERSAQICSEIRTTFLMEIARFDAFQTRGMPFG